jgi:hypothetical protein
VSKYELLPSFLHEGDERIEAKKVDQASKPEVDE